MPVAPVGKGAASRAFLSLVDPGRSEMNQQAEEPAMRWTTKTSDAENAPGLRLEDDDAVDMDGAKNAEPLPTDAGSVVLTRRGSILIIELNRPQVRNAITTEMAHGLRAAVDLLDDDADLSAAVLSGAGGTFCTGMDLKAFALGDLPVLERGGFAGICADPPRKPIIAAVEGWALAGGLEIALACDLIIAAEDARFGLPEVSRGLVAAAGGLVELPRRIPTGTALYMALTGQAIDAHQALRIGLVHDVVPAGSARTAASEVADVIARNSPNAVRLSKRIIQASRDWPERGWELAQDDLLDGIYTSHDAVEGAAAFREQREPIWERPNAVARPTAHTPIAGQGALVDRLDRRPQRLEHLQ